MNKEFRSLERMKCWEAVTSLTIEQVMDTKFVLLRKETYKGEYATKKLD